MITTILRNATDEQLGAARRYTADHLHIPFEDVTLQTAVAYVNRHFEQGVYENWDGFVEMLAADKKTNAPAKHRVIVILVKGAFRIHADGCKDIARDTARSNNYWSVEAADQHEVNLDCWGSVSTDHYELGTPEWHKACDENAAISSSFLPCALAVLPS